MPRMLITALAAFFLNFTPVSARADVLARIDLSAQRLQLYVDGVLRNTWKVSTARRGYHTPTGSYMPFRKHVMWYSRKYDMSPMPHSLFFKGGYAIHGSYEIKQLGRPASHGCIRLHPDHARILYDIVNRHGMYNTRIVITR